jgi:hypothetical protein
MGELRIFDIQQLMDDFALRAFVESGTGYGFGLYHASGFPFEQLHSIEIVQTEVDRLKQAFVNEGRVKLYCGPSPEILRRILPAINCNILFWLDAHFPGAQFDSTRYDAETDLEKRLPLQRELEAIRDLRGGYRDLIIIDDLWIYEENDYPWKNLKDVGLAHVGHFDSRFLYTTLDKTHTPQKLIKHSGYFLLTPK